MGHTTVPSTHGREKPAHKPAITFDGTDGLGLAGSVTPIFSVSGSVIIDLIIAKVLTTLTEAGATALVSLGIVSNVVLFVATDEPEDLLAGAFWFNATPTLNGIQIPSTAKGFVIDEDIVLDFTLDDTNAGVMEFFVYWRPLGSGLLVPA